MLLDRKSPLPLYAQLKEILESKINAIDWKPGTQIPTEDQLCNEYNVSRTTVRQALSELESDGLVIRQSGSGTFVNEHPIKMDLGTLTGFTQDMGQKNKRPGARVIDFKRIPATDDIAENLEVSPGIEIIKLSRLRLANGDPLVVETAHLNCQMCPNILDHDLNDKSLYQLLTREYNLVPSRATQQMMAVPCSQEYASLLNIPPGSPVLRIFRRTYDQYGNVVEWVESVARGDKYVFKVDLRNE